MLPIGAGASGVARQTQNQVQRAFDRLSQTSARLATLTKINQVSDDPAGSIAAAQLDREIRALDEASRAAERNRAVVRVADSGLGQVGDLLNQIEGHLVAASNEALSPAERDAIQLEIDAAVDAIDRIGGTTSLAGNRVFDGESVSLLAGPDPGDQATLHLPQVSSGSLGSEQGSLAALRSGGSASVTSGNAAQAAEIVAGARSQVFEARAEAGAFERNSVDMAERLFEDATVNLSSALSRITDADVAGESANLVRALIMTESSVSTSRLLMQVQRASAGMLEELMDTVG